MSGTEDDTQYKKSKTSKMAIASVLFGMLGIFVLVSRVVVYRPWWSEFVARNIVGLLGIVGSILGLVAIARISKRIAIITSLVLLCFFSLILFSFFLYLLFTMSRAGRIFLQRWSFFLSIAFLLGLLILPAAYEWKSRSKEKLEGGTFANLGIVLGALLVVFWWVETCGPVSTALGMVCSNNLSRLGKAMQVYANENRGHYPEPNQWCDLILKHDQADVEHFYCPGVKFRWKRQVFPWPVPKNARCYYAMNPDCEPNSPSDMVLLFETKGGWNKFGGPVLSTFENHGGKGCNILFNDLHVEFVRTERLGQLKWAAGEIENSGEKGSASGNFRRPANDEELEYWLENMVWYHRFTNKEVAAATGLTNKEIVAALRKFNVRLDNRPKSGRAAPLLVLPYPGGRHPRIGFLEGAIDPQREAKFSVFTPWDRQSYVVVDLPEAIWSNLGLTYLAHTHIDTIWTRQGIELPKLEWNGHPDGTLHIERKLPNAIVFGARAKPQRNAVRMEMWLKNGTKQRLTDLRVQICVMAKMAAGFEQQTNDNKVFTNPYVACRSNDGKRWIITAWENCHRPWGNERCPCFHSDAKFPDLEPGQMHRMRGWLSFYQGTDIEAEFKRIEDTGWRNQ